MNIESDEDGFVYFNELLYKTMKVQYGPEHIRNKNLAEMELKTLDTIDKL